MEAISSTSGTARGASTTASHLKAVERVIEAMRERLDEPLKLDDLAKVAMISPFHFDRIFRQMTGIPPCQFLGALRIEMARKLLLTTRLSVTDVCFDVGYNSLGTFITRFRELVGLTPRRLRCLAKDQTCAVPNYERKADAYLPGKVVGTTMLRGTVQSREETSGPIFIGLFSTPIPQGRPVSCALLPAPGAYHLGPLPDGRYHLLAVAFSWSEFPDASFLSGPTPHQVASSAGSINVLGGCVEGATDLELRQPKLTDPPILVSLPFMLKNFLSSKELPPPCPATPPRMAVKAASMSGDRIS